MPWCRNALGDEMTGIKVHCLGASREVGRSAFLVDAGDKILLDYGVKLTPDSVEYPLHVKTNIDAAVISHAHLDHSGHLPTLFNVSKPLVFLTPPTLDLARMLWHDSLKIAGMEGMEAHFTKDEIRKTEKYAFPLNYKKHVQITSHTSLQLFDAGHILGSAITKLHIGGKNFVYTGDYKPSETRLFNAADLDLGKVDYLMIESTYGDTNHPDRKKVEKEFVESVQDTVERGGHVLVAAFAVARSQELIDILHEYKVNAPIYFEGMGIKASRVFMDYPQYLKNPKFLKKALESVHFVKNLKMREKVLKDPSVIVTTAGMLTGGPVHAYLPKLQADKNSLLCLTGYQVDETPGRILMEKGTINLDGINVRPKMEVKKFDFSAHPGRDEMLATIRKLKPEKVICVHGDSAIAQKFAETIKSEGFDAVAPERGEVLEL